MESSGFFGIPGTYGERDNKAFFGHMRRTLDSLNSTFEILALELHIADLRNQFENGHVTFEELDKAREAAKKLMEVRIQKIEEAYKEATEKKE